MSVTEYTVEQIPRKSIVSFIEKHHYSHNVNGIQSYHHFGLYTEGNFGLPRMIGAMMYAIPSMPATAAESNFVTVCVRALNIAAPDVNLHTSLPYSVSISTVSN